jgi:hypothetical protein
LLAPALRACLSSSDSQLKHFADVSEGALLAAVDASVESLKQQLLRVHRDVKDVVRAKLKLEESLKNGSDKYSIRKMATGSIDDFHKGLSDRIGEKNPSHIAAFRCIDSVRLFMTSGRFAHSRFPQRNAHGTHDAWRQRLCFRYRQLQVADNGS